jgi:hypothetical protein
VTVGYLRERTSIRYSMGAWSRTGPNGKPVAVAGSFSSEPQIVSFRAALPPFGSIVAEVNCDVGYRLASGLEILTLQLLQLFQQSRPIAGSFLGFKGNGLILVVP